MPKLPKTKEEKMYDSVVAHLDAYAKDRMRHGFDSRLMAKSLGFTYGTLYNRIKNPRQFTLLELQFIANKLHISIPTLLGVQGRDDRN